MSGKGIGRIRAARQTFALSLMKTIFDVTAMADEVTPKRMSAEDTKDRNVWLTHKSESAIENLGANTDQVLIPTNGRPAMFDITNVGALSQNTWKATASMDVSIAHDQKSR